MTDTPAAEAQLKASLRKYGGSVIDLEEQQFKDFCQYLDKDSLALLLEQYRENREFYKKILAEEYRQKHPNSYRYGDAEKKLKKYNSQGLLLKTILETKS